MISLDFFFKKKVAFPARWDMGEDYSEHALKNLAINSVHHLSESEGIKVPDAPLVMFVGGASDGSFDLGFPTVMEVAFPEYYAKYGRHYNVAYGTWASKDYLTEVVRNWSNAGQKVCLIGHSWGGDTVIEIANRLSKEDVWINAIYTVDPVSHRYNGSIAKPENVGVWHNISVNYQTNPFASLTNIAALTGGYWGMCENADYDCVIDWFERADGSMVEASHGAVAEMMEYYLREHDGDVFWSDNT